jgi:hypothetical protein
MKANRFKIEGKLLIYKRRQAAFRAGTSMISIEELKEP